MRSVELALQMTSNHWRKPCRQTLQLRVCKAFVNGLRRTSRKLPKFIEADRKLFTYPAKYCRLNIGLTALDVLPRAQTYVCLNRCLFLR